MVLDAEADQAEEGNREQRRGPGGGGAAAGKAGLRPSGAGARAGARPSTAMPADLCGQAGLS